MSLPFSPPIMYFDGAEPTRAHADDAGLDIRAYESKTIPPGKRALIRTATKVAIPPGYVGLICPRSGMALNHGVTVLNSPGVIDPGYRDYLGVILHNTSDEPYRVMEGARVAQLVILPVVLPVMVADDLDDTVRGVSGFGSTGE